MTVINGKSLGPIGQRVNGIPPAQELFQRLNRVAGGTGEFSVDDVINASINLAVHAIFGIAESRREAETRVNMLASGMMAAVRHRYDEKTGKRKKIVPVRGPQTVSGEQQ